MEEFQLDAKDFYFGWRNFQICQRPTSRPSGHLEQWPFVFFSILLSMVLTQSWSPHKVLYANGQGTGLTVRLQPAITDY